LRSFLIISDYLSEKKVLAGKGSETPLMKQYYGIKAKHPNALLLFRVGDFYETFGEDAIKTSKILGIVLTKRSNGAAADIELAGFPHHALDNYLPKLVRAGQRVAICDQLEDPKLAKTIVKRGVTELVTPGVTFNEQILQASSNNFLAAVCIEKHAAAIALTDISTGEFYIAEGKHDYIQKLVQSLNPSEVLFSKKQKNHFISLFGDDHFTFPCEDWIFQYAYAYEQLTRHFDTNSLKGFGVEDMQIGIIAAGAVLHYLKETQHNELQHLTTISRIYDGDYVWMDKFTIRNLELFHSNSPGGIGLIDILDQTTTPMGSRLLKRWLAMPLKDIHQINKRLDVVQHFNSHPDSANQIIQLLATVNDLERLVSKLAASRINPREMVQLKVAIRATQHLITALRGAQYPPLLAIADALHPCNNLYQIIENCLDHEPSALLSKGGVIRMGFNAELDEFRNLVTNSKDILLGIQMREQERTGISSLKLAFNNVFGYYLEVRNTHKDKVPADWIRKQTLVNAERYITEELKIIEQKILGAEQSIHDLEVRLYEQLISEAREYVVQLQSNAQLIGRLDCLISFSQIALKRNYCRPVFADGSQLQIVKGRHPVIESRLDPAAPYVSNDVFLDRDSQQIIMVTGPNMSGKSALLRQTALIALMAQMGSFVPAETVEMGLIDKIFVRVGASDNISQGESTFMVEMNETASILNNLSERSLVLLDEIGRGTSTYDGISIAWAISEFLHEHPAKSKTLFATHYHELNEMAGQFPRIKNYNVAVKELENDVIFLRKLQEGGSQHSFGIHVARMAGMPKFVLQKANKILKSLEESREKGDAKAGKGPNNNGVQLSIFNLDDPILEEIRSDIEAIDINTLTPVEALMFLNDIKRKISKR
jgi:DNA mismatch repair protein MutS